VQVHGAFGYSMNDGGSYLSQTVMQVAGGAIIGLGTGLYQWALLKNVFPVSFIWVFALMGGFALSELLICLMLWSMQINRYELRFIEFNPLPEALIFAFAGFISGFFQWMLLRKFFFKQHFLDFSKQPGLGNLCFGNDFFFMGIYSGSIIVWRHYRSNTGVDITQKGW